MVPIGQTLTGKKRYLKCEKVIYFFISCSQTGAS